MVSILLLIILKMLISRALKSPFWLDYFKKDEIKPIINRYLNRLSVDNFIAKTLFPNLQRFPEQQDKQGYFLHLN